jgi:hypothetical protein
MGGAGAEAGNAITVSVLSPSGKPVAGASVEIRPTNSVDSAPTFSATTGPDGSARFEPGTTGKWSVLVRKDGMSFWQIADGNGAIVDTLRPMATFAGFLQSTPGAILSIPGLGFRTICDEDGGFSFDSLPSGYLPIRRTKVQDQPGAARFGLARQVQPNPNDSLFPSRDAYVKLLPTRTTILATSDTALRSAWMIGDDFIPWLNRPLPATFPAGRIPERGDFAFGVLLRFNESDDSVEALQWGDGISKGVRYGWKKDRTPFLEIDGKPQPDSITRCMWRNGPGKGGWTILNISGDSSGRGWISKGDSTCVVFPESTFLDRTNWKPPVFGSIGDIRVTWITNLLAPGQQPTNDWIRLCNMWDPEACR